ncbi:MAG: four helix bundle protein [Gammaproteobacteria bacterium]|nr:four helix bundle protein [Gammaproteobacteria bacterium]
MNTLHHLALWSRACDFTVASLEAVKRIQDTALQQQVRRALLAIPAQIAAGHEPTLPATRQRRHLQTACGHCLEARTHLHIAQRLNYLAGADADRLIRESIEITDRIVGLLRRYGTG